MALYVFDAYGTLFDVHAAAERQKDAIGPKWQRAVADLARQAPRVHVGVQPGRQAGDVLDAGAAQPRLSPSPRWAAASRRTCGQRLLASYRTMDAYPEVARGARRSQGARRPAGDPVERRRRHADDAVRAAKLDGLFDAVISVVSAGIFKPSPQGLPARHRPLRRHAGRGLVPVLQPLGHRRRQGVRLPLRVGQPHGRARRVPRPARPTASCATCGRCWSRLGRASAMTQHHQGVAIRCVGSALRLTQPTTTTTTSWETTALRSCCRRDPG